MARASALSFSGCTNPLALVPAQSTSVSDANAGASTAFTFNLERPEGNQYLSQMSTTLPKGLVGTVPAVEQCPEPQASQGSVLEREPDRHSHGARRVRPDAVLVHRPRVLHRAPTTAPRTASRSPFRQSPGRSTWARSSRGPRSTSSQYTGQVVVTTTLPRIVKGVPIRIRKITVAVTKAGFMRNPTNCAAMTTASSVTGFVPGSTESATVTASSPFQVGNCSALAFKPAFTANSGAKVSKANGASLETTLKMPSGSSNIKSVLVQLPKQLVSRLTTLNKACLAAAFENNPYSCPSGSFVGGVTRQDAACCPEP